MYDFFNIYVTLNGKRQRLEDYLREQDPNFALELDKDEEAREQRFLDTLADADEFPPVYLISDFPAEFEEYRRQIHGTGGNVTQESFSTYMHETYGMAPIIDESDHELTLPDDWDFPPDNPWSDTPASEY